MAAPASLIANLVAPGLMVAVERRRNPALCGRPVAVGGRPGTGARLAAISDEARACGVAPGMTPDEARRVCPSAVFLEGEIESYLDMQAELDVLLRRFVPAVEWDAVDSAWLALSSAEGPPHVLDGIRQAIRDVLDLDVACGVSRVRFAAGIAARLARPRGWLYVLPSYEAAFLAPVHLTLLEQDAPAFVARCRRAGITTLGELSAMDLDTLSTVCGRSGMVWSRLAAGLDDRTVRLNRHPARLVARAGVPPLFDAGAAAPEPAVWRAVLDGAAADLEAQLAELGLEAGSITVRLEPAGPGAAVVKSGLLPRPLRARSAIVAAALDVWRRTAPPNTARRLTIVAGGLSRVPGRPGAGPRQEGRGSPLLEPPCISGASEAGKLDPAPCPPVPAARIPRRRRLRSA
jgi:DNA polymerase IV